MQVRGLRDRLEPEPERIVHRRLDTLGERLPECLDPLGERLAPEPGRNCHDHDRPGETVGRNQPALGATPISPVEAW